LVGLKGASTGILGRGNVSTGENTTSLGLGGEKAISEGALGEATVGGKYDFSGD